MKITISIRKTHWLFFPITFALFALCCPHSITGDNEEGEILKISEPESKEVVEFEIEAKRIPLEIRPGIFFDAWAYGLKGKKPTVPGPTIHVKEGTRVKIHFTNHLSVPASIHPHGVKYTIEHDGAHLAGNPNTIVLPGGSRTYEWDTDGAPGTWVYHTHAFEFGGEKGLEKGLFGPIIVDPKGSESHPDKEFIVFLTGYKIGDKHFEAFNDKSGEAGYFQGNPTAFPGEVFQAKVGDKVRFHLINADSEEMHTFHIHGHRWKDKRGGELIDNVSLGPFTMYVLDIIAGENVGPGNWMVHCHFGSHMMMGMFGVLAVR